MRVPTSSLIALRHSSRRRFRVQRLKGVLETREHAMYYVIHAEVDCVRRLQKQGWLLLRHIRQWSGDAAAQARQLRGSFQALAMRT